MADSDDGSYAAPGGGLRTVPGFDTPGQFDDFVDQLLSLCDSGVLRESVVGQPYSGVSVFDERWFVDAAGRRWRLVAPDYPFRGVFEPV